MSSDSVVAKRDPGSGRNRALRFVILISVVSLFADTTYEGARSVLGPYLLLLGASATVVGIVSGLGELIAYGLRLVSGRLADRTRRYWTIAIAGYFLQLLAVPAMALAGHWQAAALLWIAERTGKGIRNPPRDAILSHAAKQLGHGRAFGLHEFLDQIGATIGPLAVAFALYLRGSYRQAFAILLVPAVLSLIFVLTARARYPNPHDFEAQPPGDERKLPRLFLIYLLSVGLVAVAYADFPLIAFHFKTANVLSDTWTPVFYSVAMGTAAVGALLMGWLYDRFGLPVLIGAYSIAAFFPVLVFYGGFGAALLGIVAWGIGLGAHESIMKSVVIHLVPPSRRASAFGMFDAGFGVLWFAGSVVLGVLYDRSIAAVVAFSTVLQVGAVVWLIVMRERLAPGRAAERALS